MNKLILKNIAKDWCKGILLACENSGANEDKLLTEEEMNYVVGEAHKIAKRITKKPALYHFSDIVKRYYEF